MQDASCRAFIDRFENGMAVLLIEGRTAPVLWPAELLPEGSREGTALVVRLAVDAPIEGDARASIEHLIDKLERGD